MPSPIFFVFRYAIQHNEQILFDYHGHRRETCPHVVGYGPDGNEQALVFQFGGGVPRAFRRLAPGGASNSPTFAIPSSSRVIGAPANNMKSRKAVSRMSWLRSRSEVKRT